MRNNHPVLGGLLLALAPEPQSTKAWETGAEGEERLGRRLDELVSPTLQLLHDRRINGTRANLDHPVITPLKATVIDAKRYRGRPHLKVRHDLRGAKTEEFYVDHRNCTKLVDAVLWQEDRIRATLKEPDLTVRAMLCFVGADWPLIGGALRTRGVDIVWPRRAERLLGSSGPHDEATIETLYKRLADAFRTA